MTKHWSYTQGAIKACKRFGFTNSQVAQVVVGSHTAVPSGCHREMRIANGLRVIVDPIAKKILGVYEADKPNEESTYKPAPVPKAKGGGGVTTQYSFDDLVKMALEQGWDKRQGSKHLVLYPADKNENAITVPNSASDWRAVKNLQAQLKRAGLEIPNG